MQVKYTVYSRNDGKISCVDIWKTNGDITHSIYEREHNISPQKVSSRGYLYFNPFFKRWSLEHYQMDDGVPAKTLREWIQKKQIEKRDRLLVRREIFRTPFFNDSQLQKETWKDKKKMNILVLRQLFTIQNH